MCGQGLPTSIDPPWTMIIPQYKFQSLWLQVCKHKDAFMHVHDVPVRKMNHCLQRERCIIIMKMLLLVNRLLKCITCTCEQSNVQWVSPLSKSICKTCYWFTMVYLKIHCTGTWISWLGVRFFFSTKKGETVDLPKKMNTNTCACTVFI